MQETLAFTYYCNPQSAENSCPICTTARPSVITVLPTVIPQAIYNIRYAVRYVLLCGQSSQMQEYHWMATVTTGAYGMSSSDGLDVVEFRGFLARTTIVPHALAP